MAHARGPKEKEISHEHDVFGNNLIEAIMGSVQVSYRSGCHADSRSTCMA